MTPEKARELREAATPGPWHVHTRDRHIDGETETWLYVGDTPALPIDHQLMSAAPELAELVANLRYEYMVQVNGHKWVRENDEGRFVLTGDPMRALRHYHPGVAAAIAKGASAQFSCECRVVRRLVGEPEVAE